jgi:hypothetical protein
MPQEAIDALINLGTLGPALVAMGWYALRMEAAYRKQIEDLAKQLLASQEARVADSMKVADRIVGIIEKQHDVLGDMQRVLEEQTVILRQQPRR